MGGTSFEQFRSSLRNPVARRAIGIEMSDDEAVTIAADDGLARAYYENWLERTPVKAPTQLPRGPQAFVHNASVGQKPRSGFWGYLGCLGVLLVAGVGFQLTRAGEDPADRNDNQSVAEVACENAVRANLKAPATASFSSNASDAGYREWTVSGYVDSENSFGAMIRTNYSCTVDITADVANATVTSLDG